jgi:hypothetical protein
MRRIATALLPLALLAPACASPEDDNDLASEAQIAGEVESFAPLDATENDLARAAPEARAFDHELTLYAIPAPKLTGLSWDTPGALARRTLFNEGLGFSHGIGHAGVRVDCGATADRPAAHFQGAMTDIGEEFRDMVLKEHAGLGVLFRTVTGTLESEDSLQHGVEDHFRGDGRVAFLRIGVSSATCRGLLDYVKEYDALDIEKRYGFVRPSFKEGSGCSAFALSFLKLAGLVEPYMQKEWKFDVLVPMTLIGGTTNPGNDVSVARLLMLGRPWAAATEPHLRLNGWDPTLMFKSIRTHTKQALEDGSALVEKRGRALGLVIDRRNVVPSEALTSGHFFRGEPSTTDPARFLTADF